MHTAHPRPLPSSPPLPTNQPTNHQVLRAASERVFVPLTVGGGIRGFSAGGQTYPALQVASEYFRWQRVRWRGCAGPLLAPVA